MAKFLHSCSMRPEESSLLRKFNIVPVQAAGAQSPPSQFVASPLRTHAAHTHTLTRILSQEEVKTVGEAPREDRSPDKLPNYASLR